MKNDQLQVRGAEAEPAMNSAQAVRGRRERKHKQNTRSHTGPAGQAWDHDSKCDKYIFKKNGRGHNSAQRAHFRPVCLMCAQLMHHNSGE